MKIEFEHEKLKKYIGKLCHCLVPNKSNCIQDNICICKEFIETGKCRCMLFKEVKE
jgi:hypothetical protein